MSNFTDGAPRSPKEWLDLGYNVFPCYANGTPSIAGWDDDTKPHNWRELFKSKTSKDNVIALRLDNIVDLDIDNPIMQKFLGEVICGAKFGRKSNPVSHLLFEGVAEYKDLTVPNAFEKYFKHFPHGRRLLDIRHGAGHFTYVPGGFRPHKKTNAAEILDWLQFTGFHKYDTRLSVMMHEIALKTALSVMFPAKGQIDDYVTSIAGILKKHSEWSDEKINNFCFDLAFKSGSENPTRYNNKGSDAGKEDKKHFGIPTLAKILEVENTDVAKLFAWVGVKDAGSMFSALRVYETEPKYWQLKYKDKWITVMDSSLLLSYTKISILILENCYEVAPVIPPKQWKEIIRRLLLKVEKIDAPVEASYYGVVMNYICEWMLRSYRQTADNSLNNLANSFSGVVRAEGYYYFKLKDLLDQLKRSTYTTEIRKLTLHLRETLGADDLKVSISGKQIRVWKVPQDNVDNKQFNNTAKFIYNPKKLKDDEPY